MAILKIFNNACRKAEPPINPDRLVAELSTCCPLVIWARWLVVLNKTEAEMLGGL
jgi:hypothetical protein